MFIEPPSINWAQVPGLLGRVTELMLIKVLCKLESALLMKRIVNNNLQMATIDMNHIRATRP